MTDPVPDFPRQLESLPIPAGATEIERKLLGRCQSTLKALYDAGQAQRFDAVQAIAYEPIVDCLIGRIQAAEKHDARIVELLTANNVEVERRRTKESELAEAKAQIATLQKAINDAFEAHESGEAGDCWQILSDHWKGPAGEEGQQP